ncbi:MAG TPA: hypothetical protein VM386_06600 [Acidimicrobiales bacterium]|nr:hypothetical protein [Acidimicrobiales bacterium]
MTSGNGHVGQAPRLSFACELGSQRLAALFADPSVIEDLRALGAGVVLMLSDLSPERADAVRKLNAAGIPVVAVPLVPFEDGYYFTADNPARAAARYDEWKEWTKAEDLNWVGLGLDIEPDVRIYQQIAADPKRVVPILLRNLRDKDRPQQASRAYGLLVERMRADGWTVENYQLPPMADERRVGSTLLQRLFGMVDVQTDREVWMLYSSFFGRLGPGLLWSYGPEAPAIAVGSTGGAPDIPGSPQVPTLNWDQLAHNLSLACHWSDNVLIHSLEGCVHQGLLNRLRSFTWPPASPPSTTWLANTLRWVVRSLLRASTCSPGTWLALTALLVLARRLRRRLASR